MLETTTIETLSPEETEEVGRMLPARFGPLGLVLLEGELGAGKTTLVRGLALGLGADPAEVSSPTFALLNEYLNDRTGELLLRHLDLYRIRNDSELREAGLLEILDEPVPVVVEWPSAMLESRLPNIFVKIEKTGETGRTIAIVRRPADGTRG
jgi:tRNA threonylcarbamoyladenosine biosynthesis protein TsaE